MAPDDRHPNETTRQAAVLAVLALALSACLVEAEGAVTSSTSAGPVDGKSDIYGADDRHELHQASALYRSIARSTAVLVSRRSFDALGEHPVLQDETLEEHLQKTLGGPLCPGERFRGQPAPGYCSGFLVGPDLVATAGHCVNYRTACAELFVVFGFAYESVGDDVVHPASTDVYACENVVAHVYRQGEQSLGDMLGGEMPEDWAVIQLDRPVIGRQPLSLRRSSQVAPHAVVTAIGHPGGVPTKISTGRVVDASLHGSFTTDLDLFGGNSGGVVVDASGAVEGLVFRGSGADSYEWFGEGCFRARRCDVVSVDGACSGNHVLRIDPVADLVTEPFRIATETLVPSLANARIPDGDAAGLVLELDFATPGTVRFVTVNANLFHTSARDLTITLSRDGGSTALVTHRPSQYAGSRALISRTVEGFEGEPSAGTWRLRVVDDTPSGAWMQTIDGWQLVVGLDR